MRTWKAKETGDFSGGFCSKVLVFIWVLAVSFWVTNAQAVVITREAELEKRASSLFERAQQDTLQGKNDEALRRFVAIVKAYPRTSVAVAAQWEVVRLNEGYGNYTQAFDALQLLIDHYPGQFTKALKRQFDIALLQLVRYDQLKKQPEARKPRDLPDRDQVSAMLRIVIENGPYAEVVAEASYYRGVALEKEGRIAEAAVAHELFMERFPNHPLADDSAYQVAYILYKRWMLMKGFAPANRERAAMAMQWFLVRYAESDKAAQARACLDQIKHAERAELVNLAAYYEKRGDERASAIYYRELASKFPDLAQEGSPLRERVLQFMEKYPEMVDEPTDPMGPPATLEDLFYLPTDLKADDLLGGDDGSGP
jgi:outer membrane protein assembly factor BamD (BamD/ComL family)